MTNWYRHGLPLDTIAVDDRAVQYGDGVFETIAIRDGRPRLWELHMRRLALGCERLSLPMPAESLLERDLERALARTATNTTFCTAKIVLTAGTGQRGYRRPDAPATTTLMGVFDGQPLHPDCYRDGVDAIVCDTRISSQPRLAGVKSLNRLDQVLARSEWDDPGVFEGLMVDAEDRIVCGTASNIFLVRDRRILTPKLTRAGVAGIMRQHLLNLLGDNDIEFEEADIPLDDLARMDEAFVCNSQAGAVPLRRCGRHQWAVGEATRSVLAMLAYAGVPECGT